MIHKLSKSLFVLFFLLLFSNYSFAESKIDKAVDQTTAFLKSVSKRGLNKNQTAEFLNNYAITLKDERTDGEVTYIFDSENYKRYKDGKVISEDGWRFSKLGALRLFNGDVKLTWKIKIGKEYPFTYKQKKIIFWWNPMNPTDILLSIAIVGIYTIIYVYLKSKYDDNKTIIKLFVIGFIYATIITGILYYLIKFIAS